MVSKPIDAAMKAAATEETSTEREGQGEQGRKGNSSAVAPDLDTFRLRWFIIRPLERGKAHFDRQKMWKVRAVLLTNPVCEPKNFSTNWASNNHSYVGQRHALGMTDFESSYHVVGPAGQGRSVRRAGYVGDGVKTQISYMLGHMSDQIAFFSLHFPRFRRIFREEQKR